MWLVASFLARLDFPCKCCKNNGINYVASGHLHGEVHTEILWLVASLLIPLDIC